MPIKLGEMLIKAGIITSAQLDEALKSQVIFGGRLGTNLIEMGCLEEEELAHVLSEKLRVPCVDPGDLMELPPETIALIPVEIAEKYRVIPLKLENRRLSLVMADPSDLPAIDEIAFLTGFIIRPMIAPEIRLLMALERYYGIHRKLRYIPVPKELGGRRSHSYGPKTIKESAPTRDVVDFSTIPGEDGFSPWSEEEESAARIEAIDRYTIDSLSQELSEAKDRDGIASALVSYIGQEFDKAAIFLVTGESISGWQAVARGNRIKTVEHLQVGLDEPSILAMVAASRNVYLGPVSETPANRRILDALGGGDPHAVLLLPMVMMRRVVTILYIEGEIGDLSIMISDLQKLVQKAVMAFEILILKNKILMT